MSNNTLPHLKQKLDENKRISKDDKTRIFELAIALKDGEVERKDIEEMREIIKKYGL